MTQNNTQKTMKQTNYEIASGIASFELNTDCSCELETRCSYCALTEHIKEFLDKKDLKITSLEESLRKAKIALEDLQSLGEGNCDPRSVADIAKSTLSEIENI